LLADAAGPDSGSNAGVHPLRAVADALLGELERVLHAYVARLRSDPSIPSAHRMSEAEVEDSLATFLADLAGTLHHLESLERESGAHACESRLEVGDATAIQTVISQRHGVQRARLGWSEQELHREFTILREEVTAAVRRRASVAMRSPTRDIAVHETEQALEVLDVFLRLAEAQSSASFRARTQSTRTGAHAPSPDGEHRAQSTARLG